MDQRSRRVAVVGFAVLLAVLAAVGAVAWRASAVRSRGVEGALREGWRARNTRVLLGLSTAGVLSADEEARVDAAKDDPERVRQILIGIHEERLADAGKDLEDAEQRKVDLQASGGYKVYAGDAGGQDLVALANGDEEAATSKMAQIAGGLQALRRWAPVSYESYAAEVARGSGQPEVAAVAPAATRGVEVRKPDPRGAIVRGGEVAGLAPAVRPERAAVAARAASTVAPIVRVTPPPAESEAAPGEELDLAARTREEAAIREVLAGWAGAMTKNDPAAEAAAYAPHLDRYFLRTNVDKGFVLADKAAYLRRGNLTAGFALDDVRIEDETADSADVRLVKDVTWQRSSIGVEHRLIRSELRLVKTGEGWRIAGERDFR